MEPYSAEKRAAIRHRTFKGGKITFHYLGASIDCVIRNLSATGACLAIESPVGIPQTFDLVINDEGSHRKCRVVWRAGKKLGLAFA